MSLTIAQQDILDTGAVKEVFYEGDLLINEHYTIGQRNMIPGVAISISSPANISINNRFIAEQPVRFTTTGVLPTGIDPKLVYYVLASGLTTSTFRVSLTVGGTAVNTSGTQSGVHSVGKIRNAITPGPVAITDNGSVTVPSGSTWSII